MEFSRINGIEIVQGIGHSARLALVIPLHGTALTKYLLAIRTHTLLVINISYFSGNSLLRYTVSLKARYVFLVRAVSLILKLYK